MTICSNGWHGFDSIGHRVDGGWEFMCDGMPRLTGCGDSIMVTRKWTRVGVKKSGWLVCYGQEPKPGMPGRFDDPSQWQDDPDVVLTFCPSCRLVVEAKP